MYKIFIFLSAFLFIACKTQTIQKSNYDSFTTQFFQTKSLNVYFSKKDNNISQKIINDIKSAKKSITLALYQFSNKNIYNALVTQYNKGVQITIYTDDREYNKTEQNLFDDLEAKGIKVYKDSSKRALMHNKILVIDKKISWFGSGNYSYHAFGQNYEDFLRAQDANLSSFFYKRIYELINKIKDDSYYENYFIKAYLTPNSKVHNAIIDAINQAQSSITLLEFLLTDSEIADALIQAKERGVKISCILNSAEMNDQYSQAEKLENNGIKIDYLGDYNHRFHNKIIIIDKKLVITGSYTLSKSAYKANFENVEFITIPSIVKKFNDYAKELFNSL